jgi:hypothetical protein
MAFIQKTTLASALAANTKTLIFTADVLGSFIEDILITSLDATNRAFRLYEDGNTNADRGPQFTVAANSGNNAGSTPETSLKGLLPSRFAHLDGVGNFVIAKEESGNLYLENLAILGGDMNVVVRGVHFKLNT